MCHVSALTDRYVFVGEEIICDGRSSGARCGKVKHLYHRVFPLRSSANSPKPCFILHVAKSGRRNSI